MRSLIAIILLAGSTLLEAGPVHEFYLDNGLKLVVKEDHRAPTVVSQVWYRVGSSYEHDGITGVSHVLEHMMFKGTDSHPAGEFSRIIAENGGSENAFTSQDFTAYYQRLEKSRLPISFELEADRMRNLHLQDDEFRKEIKVVMEERRLRTDDKPTSLAYERFLATAFISSPVRNPVIGWMNDLENMQADDLRAWYQRWYAPNNAIVVVVGDVDPQEVLALAKKHFGPLKPEEIVAPKPRLEPEQKGLRRISVKAPAEVPYVLLGYKVPVLKTASEPWEPYALDVLSGILDGGDSARFSRRLVRGSQVASSAGSSYDPYDGQQTLFLLDGIPSESGTIEALQEALLDEVRGVQQAPVGADELARVKTAVVAGEVYQLDSTFYQAMRIGKLEAVDLDWRLLDEYVERIDAVTAEQVQAVAKKYLTEDNLTIGILDPLPTEQAGDQQAAITGGVHGN